MLADEAIDNLIGALDRIPRQRVGGFVTACGGGIVTASGLSGRAGVGEVCLIERAVRTDAGGSLFDEDAALLAEIVGFGENGVQLVPYAEPAGIARGARVALAGDHGAIRPAPGWRGRVIDAMGRPIDGGPPLPEGSRAYPVQARGIPAERRRGLGGRMGLGVRALDLFTPCCEGQRMGIFAGSGVGKSTLLSMITAGCEAEVLVVGLIGERGRELHDFLAHTLGEEGRSRSVVVVATSDQPPMLRRRAAYLTLTLAEYFRDRGQKVLCLMDSVTRFAMALREIYLAAGEVPTSRGYPPGVFAELPRLLERAGPGEGDGSITGLFTVLVEGDDSNEPVSDTVRGILDGHVMLERSIAERGRFPAVDVLRSVSRTAPGCYTAEERGLIREARRLLRLHADMAELIRLGAYRGGDAELDRAIRIQPVLERLLEQEPADRSTAQAAFAGLAAALAAPVAA